MKYMKERTDNKKQQRYAFHKLLKEKMGLSNELVNWNVTKFLNKRRKFIWMKEHKLINPESMQIFLLIQCVHMWSSEVMPIFMYFIWNFQCVPESVHALYFWKLWKAPKCSTHLICSTISAVNSFGFQLRHIRWIEYFTFFPVPVSDNNIYQIVDEIKWKRNFILFFSLNFMEISIAKKIILKHVLLRCKWFLSYFMKIHTK